MTQVDCTVHQIILRTADLRKLSEPERRLLLTLGHAANEMAAFYRAAYTAGMAARHDADLITQQIALAQTLLMLRMAASKMYELIKISTKDQEYQKIIGSSYPDFHVKRKEVEKLIGKHIPLETLRNFFGFHYKKKIYDSIDTIYLQGPSSDETHDIIIHRHSVNSFFAISEFLFQKAFAAAMKSNSSYEDFADRIILQLVPDFMVAVDKLIAAVHHVIIGLLKSAEVDLGAPERRNETAVSFTRASEARLPAFILFDRETKR
jgi:hypothetical protein